MPVTIMLDDYEIANLRAAIEAAGYRCDIRDPEPPGRNPLWVLNNGDWLGQIFQKLPKVGHTPNRTPEELAKAARAFQ